MDYAPLRSFYTTSVTNEHTTGDIWSNLPTFGLFKKQLLPGVIITPSCDLANDKVETITYLPIIPIKYYLTTNSFLSEIKGIILSLSDQIQYSKSRMIIEESWHPTPRDICELKEGVVQIMCSGKKKNQKEKLLSLIEHLEKIVSNEWLEADMTKMATALGESNFDRLLKNIATNNHRNDIHFVPADQQAPSWTTIKHHSLIMFRCPLTAPIEIFDLAQLKLTRNWEAEINIIAQHSPIARWFNIKQPIKGLRISQPFLHDMINRFVALYARLGSPDFTSYTIQKLIEELKD